MAANGVFSYRRYAEALLELRLNDAGRKRLRQIVRVHGRRELGRGPSPQELDDLYLIQLSMHVDDELQKPHMDLLRVATELDWSRTKLWRRLHRRAVGT